MISFRHRFRVGKGFLVEEKICPINWECYNNGFPCDSDLCPHVKLVPMKDKEQARMVVTCIYFEDELIPFLQLDLVTIREIHDRLWHQCGIGYVGDQNNINEIEWNGLMRTQKKVKLIRKFYPECMTDEYVPKKKKMAIVMPDGVVRVKRSAALLDCTIKYYPLEEIKKGEIATDDLAILARLWSNIKSNVLISPSDFDTVSRSLPKIVPWKNANKDEHERLVQEILGAIDIARMRLGEER